MMLSSSKAATTTWNRHGPMYDNNKTTVTKEQHPLRMINDNDGDDDDHSTTSSRVSNDDNDGDDLTDMHLNINKDHLMQRDDYLQNFLLENSSTAFETLMSNPSKTVTLTNNNNVNILENGNNSWGCNVTICDSTTRTTATTATTTRTSGGSGRPPLMKKTQHPSNPPRNMDSMPHPIPAIVMSKSESYDALLSSSSSSSSSSGEMTSETSTSTSSSSSASKSQEQDNGERTKDSQSQANNDENEWYPDSPTTVADASLLEQQQTQQQSNGDSTKGCSPKSIPSIDHLKKPHERKKEAATTTKTKKDQALDATAATLSNKSEFLRNQRCLEKKSDFKECFKLFFKGKRGELISPLHDFSLRDATTPDDITIIVEVPKGSKAKMFVSSQDEYTPIVQDLSPSSQTLRYYDCPFYWNMGFIPQTWQAEGGVHRPLGLIDISSKNKLPLGGVTKVKVLGALGLLDPNAQEEEEVIEWKLICIQANDPKSMKYNDIHDVPNFIQSGIREWFRWHSSSNNAVGDADDDNNEHALMKFAFDEQYQSRSFALKLIEQAHEIWKETF